MGIKLAFIAGWVWSQLIQWHFSPPTLSEEAQGLREEIRAARQALLSFQETQAGLEWRVWIQNWIIRGNLIFHLVCLVWFLYVHYGTAPRTVRPLPISDTGGSSSDTDESTSRTLQRASSRGSVFGLKGARGRGRPTRPSDLK